MTQLPDYFSPQIQWADRFFLELKPAAGVVLEVVGGGLETCAADYRVRREDFPFWCLEFVAGGEGEVTFSGRQHALVPGAVFTYGPGIPHDIATHPRRRLVKYFVSFTGSGARGFLERARLPPAKPMHTRQAEDLRQGFDLMVRQGRRAAPWAGEFCRPMLEAIGQILASSLVPESDRRSRAYASFERCRDHLEQRFLEVTTLAEIATACRLDPCTLSRLYRRFARESPRRHLLRLRMRHAAELLRLPGTLVKQAAAALGYADAFQFSRAFKGVYGVAPEHFQRLVESHIEKGRAPPGRFS